MNLGILKDFIMGEFGHPFCNPIIFRKSSVVGWRILWITERSVISNGSTMKKYRILILPPADGIGQKGKMGEFRYPIFRGILCLTLDRSNTK